MFLEVVLLSRVEFLGASGHDLTVSRNDVSLVEVVNVVSQRGLIELGVLGVELESEMLEAGVLNNIELDKVRGKFSDSSSDLIKGVVREWSSKLLRESS